MAITSVQLPVPQLTAARRPFREQTTRLLAVTRRAITQSTRHRTSTPTPSDQALSTIDHIPDLHR